MANLKQNCDTKASVFAENYFSAHKTSKEWKFSILSVLALKILASVVSIFAGFSFFSSYLYPFLGNRSFTVFFSIFFLVALEVITISFIAKSFKFGFKKDFKSLLFPLLLTVFLFSLSFIISTKGIAIWRSSHVDQTAVITDTNNIEKNNIVSSYDARVHDLKQEIEILKGHTWKGRLSAKLLDEIKAYNEQIFKLQSLKKAELAELKTTKEKSLRLNKSETSSEAEKYFLFVAVVMFFQLFTQFLIAHFAYKILLENKPEKLKNEKLLRMQANIKKNIDDYLLKTINSQFIIHSKSIALLSDDIIELDAEEVIDSSNFPDDDNPFFQEFRIREDDEQVKEEIDFDFINTEPKPNKNKIFLNQKICKHCGKSFVHNHKKQIFCSPKCRVEHWEAANNRKVKYANV